MKKVLFIGTKNILGIAPNGNELPNCEIKKVEHSEGMATFLSDDWDVVCCAAENKDFQQDEEGGWTNLLNDIYRSAQPGQKVFRVGFLPGGTIPLLQLPFDIGDLTKCLE